MESSFAAFDLTMWLNVARSGVTVNHLVECFGAGQPLGGTPQAVPGRNYAARGIQFLKGKGGDYWTAGSCPEMVTAAGLQAG